MAAKVMIGKVLNGVLLVLITLGLALSAGCGGGGGGGDTPPPAAGEVPVVLGQSGPGDAGNRFPFAINNQWEYQVTRTETGLPPQNFANTVTITETRVVGGQTVTVFQESNPDGFGIPGENFLVKDLNGIANFGNSDPTDTVTPLLVPFWEVRFPLESGASFVALDRNGVDFGEDLDGDTINEKFDLRAVVTTVGFESVTVPAGTFANSARIRADLTFSIILSSNATRVPATIISTSWYAPGVGLVKSEKEFQMTFEGVTTTETTVEVLMDAFVTEPPPPDTFTVVNDSFTWLGNSRIAVPAAFGVLANDVGAVAVTAGQTPSVLGVVVDVTADGGFTYEPPVGFIGTDSFTYTATNAGGATATGTVNITISQMARYVMNNFLGTPNGSSTAPFTTLAAAANASAPGDIIFVYAGDGTATGQNVRINLLANQRLIGQGVGLTFDVLPTDPNNALLPIAGAASTAALPATPPILTNTAAFGGNLPLITLANNVEVAGFIIDGAGAVSNLLGMAGSNITGFNIHDNTIRNLPKAAIQLLGTTGGTGMITGNTIENIQGANPDNAIDIVTTAEGVDFAITANTLDAVLETGIRVQFPSGTVTVTGNTLTNVGTVAGSRGIDVDGAGTTTISGNSVDNTGVAAIARAGIQLNATGTLAASITGNTVLNATPADGGFQAQTTLPASSLCLRMTGNTTDSGIVLDNRTTGNVPANFRVEGPLQANFEAANTNTGIFTYLLNVGAFSFVPVGTCGFAP